MEELKAKTALVTGGTRGIGLAIVRRFVEAGATVVAVSRHESNLQQVRDEFKGNTRVVVEQGDVRDRSSLERIRDRLSSLDVLVANAGHAVRVEASELDDESLRDMIDTNYYGAFVTCQTFAPLLLQKPGGRVILTGSISGEHGQRLRVAYCGTKGAIHAITRGLAVEYGPKGTTVNAIAPGIIQTPLIAAYAQANPDRVDAAVAHTALRRLGTPEDIADVALFFASDASRFVTGQVLVADGGLIMGSDWW